jgi:DNA polymerase-3 subunit delta'
MQNFTKPDSSQILQNMFEKGTVPHTLLLVGSDLADREHFALAFAIRLMGPEHAQRLKKREHPDLHIYKPEGKTQTHPVESMRNLIDEVALAPFEAKAKLFLIYDAERMLPASSNALLKTFEEPPPNTYFMLFCQQPDAMLPTITSRCHKILFASQASVASIDPLLLQILQSSDPIVRSKLLADLEDHVESEEDLSLKSTLIHTLFEQLLYWYRDLQLLSLKLPHTHLFHKNQLAELQTSLIQPPVSLDRVLPLIEECRFGVQQHVKLRVALEYFFLQIAK